MGTSGLPGAQAAVRGAAAGPMAGHLPRATLHGRRPLRRLYRLAWCPAAGVHRLLLRQGTQPASVQPQHHRPVRQAGASRRGRCSGAEVRVVLLLTLQFCYACRG